MFYASNLHVVDTFLEVTGTKVVKADVAHCWSELPTTVLPQRDEGTFVEVISHLDNLAQCQPTRKAWDELVFPPPPVAPCSPCWSRHFGYIQGQVVELGRMLPHQPAKWGLCLPGGCFLRATSWPTTLPAMKPSWSHVGHG